ncbi:MAG: hypothetical protein AB2L14_00865 [Candidatus Xenobiia bacterium LiM19]
MRLCRYTDHGKGSVISSPSELELFNKMQDQGWKTADGKSLTRIAESWNNVSRNIYRIDVITRFHGNAMQTLPGHKSACPYLTNDCPVVTLNATTEEEYRNRLLLNQKAIKKSWQKVFIL